MVIAIGAGVLAGVAGFLPLLAGQRLARRATPTSNLGFLGALLLGALVSFVVLAVGSVICIVAFRAVVLPFVLAEFFALIGSAAVYGAARLVRT